MSDDYVGRVNSEDAGGSPRLGAGMLATLGFIAMTASLSINMYLPGFAVMASDLGVPASAVQSTMTACLVGLAIGQLTLGPLSDRFGRRPVLVPALLAFALSGAGIALSEGIEWVLVFRLTEGFSAAAGMAVARAMAGDLTRGPATVKALSLIALCVGLGPLIAPLVGAIVVEQTGWQGVFWLLGGIGLVMCVLSVTVLPESLPRERRLRGGIWETYRSFGPLLRDSQFVGALLAYAVGFTGLMSFITAAPFVANNVLGMSTLQFALIFAAGSLAMSIANIVNARFADRASPTRMLKTAGLLSFAAAALFAASAFGWLTPGILVAVAMAFYCAYGFINANATALGIARSENARGAAAALMGTSQFVLAGLVSPLVGLWGDTTAAPAGFITLLCAGVVLVVAVRMGRNYR